MSKPHRIAGAIFVAAVCLELFFVHMLPLSLSIDSYGYIAFAADPFADTAPVVRTPGYPLLIAATGSLTLDTLLPLVLLQALLVTSVPVLCFYALAPAGQIAGVAGATLAAAYAYPYTMTLQVMTEATYMSGLMAAVLIFAIYVHRRRLPWLAGSLALIGLIAEIRPSANLLFPCVAAGAALVAMQHRSRRHVMHALLALAVTAGAFAGRPLVTDRNSANITPFFVWHWLSQCRLVDGGGITSNPDEPDSTSCVSLDNGPATRELFSAVRQMLAERRGRYDELASGRDFRGAPSGLRAGFTTYDAASIDRLVDDLVTNTRENPHRGPAMVTYLWEHIGLEETGRLLRAAIGETLMAHPRIVREKLVELLDLLILDPRLLALEMPRTPNALHDNVYWHFVPRSLQDRPVLDQFPAGPGAYSQWLVGLDRLTGVDPEAKELSGRFPDTWDESWRALRDQANYTTVGLFVGNWLTRVLGETLFLMSVVSIVPALMTSLWPVAAVAFVASWGLTAASFVVQDNYRHIMMHVPLLFLVHALAMAGVGNALRRPRSPGPLEPPPP